MSDRGQRLAGFADDCAHRHLSNIIIPICSAHLNTGDWNTVCSTKSEPTWRSYFIDHSTIYDDTGDSDVFPRQFYPLHFVVPGVEVLAAIYLMMISFDLRRLNRAEA
jgi:hypothetical protein